jgi:hypothetical protein
VWDAFWRLSTDRQIGAMGGVGRIPWSSIDRFAERRGMGEQEAEEFTRLIEVMDLAYTAHANEKQPDVKVKQPLLKGERPDAEGQ